VARRQRDGTGWRHSGGRCYFTTSGLFAQPHGKATDNRCLCPLGLLAGVSPTFPFAPRRRRTGSRGIGRDLQASQARRGLRLSPPISAEVALPLVTTTTLTITRLVVSAGPFGAGCVSRLLPIGGRLRFRARLVGEGRGLRRSPGSGPDYLLGYVDLFVVPVLRLGSGEYGSGAECGFSQRFCTEQVSISSIPAGRPENDRRPRGRCSNL
jgi:hypothetical protein